MFTVKLDKTENVLHLTFSGEVGRTQARQCREAVEKLLPTVLPGFRLLTDLSELEHMEYTCAPEIERVMDLCRDKGLTTVVRVIPDPKKDIGFKLMSLFHYRRTVGVITCETMAEAIKALSASHA